MNSSFTLFGFPVTDSGNCACGSSGDMDDHATGQVGDALASRLPSGKFHARR
jgi:hypothetical protein